MSPIARVKEQPRRGKTLVFSMMMIMSVFSAGIPVATATGQNGEWINVDMSQGHWNFGDTVEANITGGNLAVGDGYEVKWMLEDMNMSILDNGTYTISQPTDGQSFEYDLYFANLTEDCFMLRAELLDNQGGFMDDNSMSFDVGTGMCQQGPGPSGPHMWWNAPMNGSSQFASGESVVFFAGVGGLDEASDYTLQWEVLDESGQVAYGDNELIGVGQETSIEIQIGELIDACYEISGMLDDSDGKQIQGSEAYFMFQVGNVTCQNGPPQVDAYVSYYDGKLTISSFGFEPNQQDLNIQVSVFDDGIEIYGLNMPFTADENGMFSYEDESMTFEDGEYPLSVLITNTTDNSTLFEGFEMTLYAYNGGSGPDNMGMDVWTQKGNYQSSEEVWVEYDVQGTEGDYLGTIWDCEMIFIPESALQGNHSADNIESKMKDAVMPTWCDSDVDEAMIQNGTGGDMFGGETVWIADETVRISYQYNGDLNLTISLYGSGDESSPVEDECNEDIEHVYNSEDDSCEMSMTFITFDVGEEYIWLEEPGEIMFVCGNQQDEIPFDEVNDGDEDCPDGSDEPQDFDSDGITDNWFDCHDGSNVSMDLVNDGTEDCPDGDDEGEGDVEVKGEHLRYSTSTDSVILADMDDVHEQLYDAYIQVFNSEDVLVMNISTDDCEEDKCNLGPHQDGHYSVGGILVDGDGMTVWNSEYRSHFCVGPDCGGSGPVWQTGNATLNLTLTNDEYDSAECEDKFTVMLFHLEDLQNDMNDEENQGDGNHEDDGDGNHEEGDNGQGDGGEHDGPSPVWADTRMFDTNSWELNGLPEGDWVVIALINCMGNDGEKYDLMAASGGLSGGMHELTFTNGSTTDVSMNMAIMTHDNGNDGGLEQYMTGDGVFQIMVEDSPDGLLLISKQEMKLSDSARKLVDETWGDEDGVVSETEAIAATQFFMMMMTEEGRSSDTNGSDGDQGMEDEHKEDSDGPEFAWNGVTLVEQDIIYEDMTIEGLVGPVPSSSDEDTESVRIVMRVTYLLVDNGEDIQVLSPPEEEGDNGHGDEDKTSEDCELLSVYVSDSETWNVESITDGGNVYTYDAESSTWSFDYACNEKPTDDISMSFSRVVTEEPEPTVNTPPTCEIYWFDSDDSLADGKEGGHEADEGTATGDFDIELTEGEKYTLMFYCDDAEGDEITVTVDPSIGESKTMTGNGSLSGYYEFDIPTGTSALGEMSFDYVWTDGNSNNTGDGTVTVNVLENKDAEATDDTAADDVSAGSFVPGFTAVLTMTALAGAFLVFSRREDE